MRKVLVVLVLATGLVVPEAAAQQPTARGAFFRSLVLPGWGHQYAHGGSWGRSGSAYALADVSLLLGATGSEIRRESVVESYRTLASGRAQADVDGKDRTFFLRLATFMSSDEFVESSLRNRAWDDVDYAADPSFQWEWASREDFVEFRTLREDGERLRRRRTAMVAMLVANRLVSGLTAARSARRGGGGPMASVVPTREGTRASLTLTF